MGGLGYRDVGRVEAEHARVRTPSVVEMALHEFRCACSRPVRMKVGLPLIRVRVHPGRQVCPDKNVVPTMGRV